MFREPEIVRRILFVTLSNIGDVVMTTPTLEALHRRFPQALVDIVADPRSACLFRYCPYLGRLILKDKRAGLRGVMALVGHIREQRYDLAVDLRTDGLLHMVRAGHKCHKLGSRDGRNMHSVEKHFSCLHSLGQATIPPPKIWLPGESFPAVQAFLAPMAGKKLLALALGANSPAKIWPPHNFAQLAEQLVSVEKRFDAVLLVGDSRDAARAAELPGRYSGPLYDACGCFDLLETAATLAHCDYFIGNDSGLGHIASALGKPTFTIFGTESPQRYRPWGELACWIQDPLKDINRITAEVVLAAIQGVTP